MEGASCGGVEGSRSEVRRGEKRAEREGGSTAERGDQWRRRASFKLGHVWYREKREFLKGVGFFMLVLGSPG